MHWRSFRFVTALWGVLLLAACHSPAASDTPQLLYFMSFSCPACRQANPLLENMHQKAAGQYGLRALAFGSTKSDIPPQQQKAGLSFPIEPGDKAVAQKYAVRVTPTILLLRGEVARERYQGMLGVLRLQRLIEDGQLGKENGILELATRPAQFAGAAVALRGQVTSVGTDASAVLGNGVETIRLQLPAERPIPPTLSGRELRAEGTLAVVGDAPLLEVRQWTAVQ